MHGTVVEATHAPYKRAFFMLRTQSLGDIEVVCYHKAANLLMAGDKVSLRGWMLRDGRVLRLVQMLSVPDNIVWHQKA